jgi:hypothetical protein
VIGGMRVAKSEDNIEEFERQLEGRLSRRSRRALQRNRLEPPQFMRIVVSVVGVLLVVVALVLVATLLMR